jgi:hypothetical protein
MQMVTTERLVKKRTGMSLVLQKTKKGAITVCGHTAIGQHGWDSSQAVCLQSPLS